MKRRSRSGEITGHVGAKYARTKPDPVTVTLHLPVLDDATAVMIYNFLCDLVDRFDAHYGKQICHFYSQQTRANSRSPPTSTDDAPF